MGLLDSLFQYNSDDAGPVGQQSYGFNDYVGDVPTKRAVDAWDEDPKLKKLREENPLGPDERGPNPLVEQLKRNFENFSNAKPPAPGDTSYAPPITWKDPYGKGAAPVPGMLGPEMAGPYGAVSGYGAVAGPSDVAQLVTPAGQPVTAAASPAPAAGQPAPPPAPPTAGLPPGMLSKTPMGPQPITPPPGDVALPPGATPTMGQGRPGAVQPSGAHGSGSPAENAIDVTHAGPGMLSKIWQGLQDNSGLLLGMGAGMLGAPSWATGLSRGASGALAGSQIDQRNMLQTRGASSLYQALVQAGVPQLQAVAATTNPALAQKLTDEYLVSRKKELKEVTLPNQAKITVQWDPYEQKAYDMQGQPFDINSIQGGGGMIDPTLTGQAAQDALQRADPDTYRHAMALVEGRERWPVGRAMSAPGMKQAVDAARQIDPDLTDETGPLRYQTVMDYGPKGKTGATRLALSNMMGHAEQLDLLNKIIGNYDLGGEKGNWARNALKQMLGTDKTYLDAKAQAQVLRQLLAGEANMAFSGSHAVTGTREFEEGLGADKGLTSQHGAIKGIIHAAGTRLGELQSQFDSAMKTRSEGFHMLSPKAQKIFQKWEGKNGMDYGAKAPGSLPEAVDSAEAFGAPEVAGVKTGQPAPAGKTQTGISWSVQN